MSLKYLFLAEYKNGSTYEQNVEDISNTDEKRSCFFDVKQDEVQAFFLINKENVFSVHLDDGHFEVNNTPFFLHDKAIPMTEKRLIYFRQHTHQFNAETKAELSHEIIFCMGWQANDSGGKNIQHIMQIL